MPDKTAEELEKRAWEFMMKWDSDHNAVCYTDKGWVYGVWYCGTSWRRWRT